MAGRIIELTTPGRSIRKERGFLVISEQREILGRVPLDDIEAVISSTPGLYWSGNVLAALAERSVPVVFVGTNFTPVAHILPLAAIMPREPSCRRRPTPPCPSKNACGHRSSKPRSKHRAKSSNC